LNNKAMIIVDTVDISWSCPPPSSVLQRYQDKGKPQLYSRRALAGSGRTEVQNGVWSMEYGAYGGRRGERGHAPGAIRPRFFRSGMGQRLKSMR
jgi:hypothetical protein